MSFSSPAFLFAFLPLVLTGYLLMPGRAARNGWLLVASLAFYAWGEGVYAGLLLGSIAINHGLGLWVRRLRGRPGAAWIVTLAVTLNLALLAVFKYPAFLADNANVLLALVGAPLLERPRVHLPVGLSFYTFQALSYVLDIHLDKGEAQRNPLNTALYVALFPQLVLGPIVRYRHIAAELTRRTLSVADFTAGAQRFATGLGKKVLIADTLAVVVDAIYNIPSGELTPGLAWLAVGGFTLQLYFDFSGYSDMAIGLGRMFGFHFRENFNYPLFARSRSDYFRRWHISFFTWMRDYVYMPLAGRDGSRWREQINILIVFFLAGLWHGASWTFVIWGVANGVLIIVERLWLLRRLQALWRPLQHAYMLAWTLAGMALFRAASPGQAWDFLRGMAGWADGAGVEYHAAMFLSGEVALAFAVGTLAAVPLVPAVAERCRHWVDDPAASTARLAGVPAAPFAVALPVAGVVWYGALLLVSAMVLASRTYTPFVYFQF